MVQEEKKRERKYTVGEIRSEQSRQAYLGLGFTAEGAGEVLERRCMQEAPKAMLEVCLPVGLR